MSVKQNMKIVLEALAKMERDEIGEAWVSPTQLQQVTNLSPADLNDAVEILVRKGLAEWRQYLGTAPFKFGQVTITSQGRLSLQ